MDLAKVYIVKKYITVFNALCDGSFLISASILAMISNVVSLFVSIRASDSRR